jgi:hypothetical protein
MRRPPVPDPHVHLLPAGRRWGFGAHSVLPYLVLALQARPDAPEDAAIRNPVFPQMETTLRKLRRRH